MPATPAACARSCINLIGNALKFTNEGEVSLQVHAGAAEDKSYLLHFVVADTGIGIAPEKLPTIFESFSQADTSTTREFGGTGLGLTISRRLVEMMGGTLWVESELGVGSNSTSPSGRPSRRTNRRLQQPRAASDIARRVKVLVVDDNRTNRRILDGLLKHWGMLPTAWLPTENRRWRRWPPRTQPATDYALVITDMHMPKMDGFGLITASRQAGDASTATIMMLSSGAQRGDATRCCSSALPPTC